MKLLYASPADYLPALVLMTFCGIRNGEMFRLDWSAVDWEDGTIEVTVEQGKREGHARHVDIPANALEWLLPLAGRPRRRRVGHWRVARERPAQDLHFLPLRILWLN